METVSNQAVLAGRVRARGNSEVYVRLEQNGPWVALVPINHRDCLTLPSSPGLALGRKSLLGKAPESRSQSI